MHNIFDYAREKIKKEYHSRHDYSYQRTKQNESMDIWYINEYEKESKKNLRSALFCRVKVLWYILTEDEKATASIGLGVIAFIAIVFLYGIKHTPLNILILNSSESFFSFFLIMCAIFIYRLIRRKNVKNNMFYIIGGLFILLSLPHIPVLCGYETTQIGDFYEAREYTEKYYVVMSREPESVQNRKKYTLPAEIERRTDYLYTTEVYEDYYFQEHGGNDIYRLAYHINYLYFPNGGYLTFVYDEVYENPEYSTVLLNQETKVTDYYDNDYYITLTSEKVE